MRLYSQVRDAGWLHLREGGPVGTEGGRAVDKRAVLSQALSGGRAVHECGNNTECQPRARTPCPGCRQARPAVDTAMGPLGLLLGCAQHLRLGRGAAPRACLPASRQTRQSPVGRAVTPLLCTLGGLCPVTCLSPDMSPPPGSLPCLLRPSHVLLEQLGGMSHFSRHHCLITVPLRCWETTPREPG